MRRLITFTVLAAALLCVSASHAEKQQVVPGFAWANGILYGTKASSKYEPAAGARDTLLVFKGLKGQRAVAETGPGDINYHDGRWQVVFLEYTPEGKAAFDVNNDGFSEFEITSWDMAQHYLNEHNYFKIVEQGPTFDSPLMRPKGLEPPDKATKK